MNTSKKMYFEKRGKQLVENLKRRHFDAYYCQDSAEALRKALELIPAGSSIGWGGTVSAQQIGLLDAVRTGDYRPIDRDLCTTAEERDQAAKDALFADVYLAGANAMSMDGEMVSIDGTGNRLAAIIFGPKKVIVIVGMNKVCDTLDAAIQRARTVAAPMNMQRFMKATPCAATGCCADCKSAECICNQILVTRNCRPAKRICYLVVGEELGY